MMETVEKSFYEATKDTFSDRCESPWLLIESVPIDGRHFFVWIPSLDKGGFIPIDLAFYDAENKEVVLCNYHEDLEPTHWMELPDGPKDKIHDQ